MSVVQVPEQTCGEGCRTVAVEQGVPTPGGHTLKTEQGQGPWRVVAELGQGPDPLEPTCPGTPDWAVDRMQATSGGVAAWWPWRTGIPAVAYLLGFDTGPSAHRGNQAGVTVHSCPAAPCAQERAPQASRLLPQPAPWAPLWKGWVREGHTSMLPGLLRFHPPLPLRAPVSCRSPTARPGSTLRSCPFLPFPPFHLCWGGSVPRAGGAGTRHWWRPRCGARCLSVSVELSPRPEEQETPVQRNLLAGGRAAPRGMR